MRTPRRRAFSLIELVIVVVILGILGAIAIPRMGQRVERSRTSALVTTTKRVQEAIDRYTAEHEGQSPAYDRNGALDTDGDRFVLRITGPTTLKGQPVGSGIYGPYILKWPINPINGLETVRINGAVVGANTHGWRYDVGKQLFLPDDDTIGRDSFDDDGGTVDMGLGFGG